MSDKEEKGSVFVEGSSVVTTSSPYDQYRNVDLEYVSTDQVSISTPNLKRKLRLECIKLALQTNKNLGEEHIIGLAKRYYQYVKTGE